MAVDELDPSDCRDQEILRAQGVLAERLGVDVHEADRGLRAYSAITATALYDVAWQVVYLGLVIDRDLCR